MDSTDPATTSAKTDGPVPVADVPEDTAAPPVRWQEIAAVVALVVLCDITIYRSCGFSGWGLMLALAPWCLLWGAPAGRWLRLGWVFLLVLSVLAFRLVWCGTSLTLVCGLSALVAWAMCLTGRTPHVLSIISYAGQSIAAGARGLNRYGQSAHFVLQPIKMSAGLSVIFPLAAVLLFGLLFVMANPDLVSSLSRQFQTVFEFLQKWFEHFSLLEIPFWIGVAWIAVGLLRPLPEVTSTIPEPTAASSTAAASLSAALYVPFRNTLVAVIGLFAVYLVFEFRTLWFRQFPAGFHYSGYAHEGAAWLTVALGLATVVLSLIFRGEILRDARLPRLKGLAWVWSGLNLLLAAAVFHRLWIYVGFNGMTRMRMVAFFGTTTVVLGLVFVIVKIARHRRFAWLFQADLWALLGMVMLYSAIPVDVLVMKYNVARIMAGDSVPSVQISSHLIDAGGVRELLPLMRCEDEIVRDGVKALFARRWTDLPSSATKPWADIDNWCDLSSLQIAERWLATDLAAAREEWNLFREEPRQSSAWQRFQDYAYQWY